MRGYIYSLLTDESAGYDDGAVIALHALVPSAQIRASGGADVGPQITLPVPFIVIRSLSDVRVFNGATRRGGAVIHVHDQPDSYKQIDAIMKILVRIMDTATARWWGGVWIQDVQDQGWSEDLYDDHYGTATRYGTYGIIARQ